MLKCMLGTSTGTMSHKPEPLTDGAMTYRFSLPHFHPPDRLLGYVVFDRLHPVGTVAQMIALYRCLLSNGIFP